MRRIFLLLGMIVLLSDCKKDNDSPASVIQKIFGRWRLVEYETTQNGQKVWVKADTAAQQTFINIDNDGLILDDQGYLPCCPPEWLTINGNQFKIIKKEGVFTAPMCASVSCVACPNLKIQQSDNESETTHCIGFRTRYIRD